ncbi:MAG: hypothetical protein IPG10_18045 [Flavobacteriales bacterium]|jgi:hypothetical protein|nr:hypothetical protein [Flavobacteriales bacterium]MBK7751895.1 hypothetical protein [Flavobacteriales bacterium]MBK9539670.1 hypothetical protein [Flavobacteriales bacterium]
MRALLFLGLGVCSSYAYAQSFNGSFEDTLGNYNDSGWVSTCSVLPGPAAPGFGSVGVLVPHSNTSSCTGWSRFYHYVPWIADGETWTLSGWCGVFTFPFFSPYVGLRFGWKDALGTVHFNTAALTNNGGYTFLSVTNTFALAPGDTVFVECDAGTAGGMGVNQLFAMFDGLTLSQLPTSVVERSTHTLALGPNPVRDHLWVGGMERVREVRCIDGSGRMSAPRPFEARAGTVEVTVVDLPPGMHVLYLRSDTEVRTVRFVKE